MCTTCKMANRIFLLCLLVSVLTVTYIEGKGGRGRSGGRSRSSSRSSHSAKHSWGSSSSSSGSSGSHGYPSSSSGLSGTGSSGWNHGSSSYPSSSSGLSGSGSSWKRPTHYYHNTVPYAVPTYYTAPQYVYMHEYRNSNSRYGDLLTGLSLYNLGRSHSHYHDHYYYDDYYRRRYDNPSSSSYRQEDKPQDQANCILKVKENGRVEVLKIPCEIVSTFTQGSKKVAPSQQTQVNKTVCTTTTTKINNTVSSAPAAPVVPVLSVLPALAVNGPSITVTSMPNKTRQVNGFDSNEWLAELGIADTMKDIQAIMDELPVNGPSKVSVSGSSINSTVTAMSSRSGQVNGFDSNKWFAELGIADTMKDMQAIMDKVPVNGASMTDMDITMPIYPKYVNKRDINSKVSPTVTTTTLPVNGSSVNITKTVTTVNATTVNVTVCTTTSTLVDPLTMTGPPVNAKDMECVVEIQTRDSFLSNVVDCSTLIAYAKVPEPKKEAGILPQRAKLKSWLANPPWWMSLFIAV